jgi:hemerythrin
MNPIDIRDELVAQHDDLRAHLGKATMATEKWRLGEVSRSHVRDVLAELADALREHNLHEERTLRELIRSVDGHEEIMGDDHVNEHREMLDTLMQVSQVQDPGQGGRELEKFCARMLAHMTREERALLNTAVGTDASLQ